MESWEWGAAKNLFEPVVSSPSFQIPFMYMRWCEVSAASSKVWSVQIFYLADAVFVVEVIHADLRFCLVATSTPSAGGDAVVARIVEMQAAMR
jgi:hypothetical protein